MNDRDRENIMKDGNSIREESIDSELVEIQEVALNFDEDVTTDEELLLDMMEEEDKYQESIMSSMSGAEFLAVTISSSNIFDIETMSALKNIITDLYSCANVPGIQNSLILENTELEEIHDSKYKIDFLQLNLLRKKNNKFSDVDIIFDADSNDDYVTDKNKLLKI